MLRLTICAAAGLAAGSPAWAQHELRNGGKLVLTNGISTIEGASGGGLTPWAVIAGNETKDGIGIQAAATAAEVESYDFRSFSVAIGIKDRIEFSYARQNFNTNEIGGALGLGNNYAFDQDIYGAKVKLFGDLVYGPEMLPAVAIGVEYKKSLDAPVVKAVGARHSEGADYYVSASKLFLRHSILVNLTGRLTKANQLGLLGFGGRDDKYRVQIEGSAAIQLSRRLALGAEFRSKPDNLAIAREDDWFDLFGAYALGRHLTLTAAYADLGSIATVKGQRGALFQIQAGF
ncbi:DUF3034 family protein [Sphingomonas sp. JC676]|uniref:DUF3034 family protein n=1 Tax=Sphingomonas sp. JC676 TaxID=2768065 RepID=UPI001657E831|nr:DUF3034 family protein [Sphingomonas sp. JC676]MBC9032070.1 DUF3034 family protein [Sphingomonas sp. JC676]